MQFLRALVASLLILFCFSLRSEAKTAIFWQDGFPTLSSEPISKATLDQALVGDQPSFLTLEALLVPASLTGVDLLVLPYGSAFPVDAWTRIHEFVVQGGNLLVIGGQPFRVPVRLREGRYQAEGDHEAYERALGILHTYEAPGPISKQFAWRDGYGFLGALHVEAAKVFVLESHRLDGLGYLMDDSGERTSAPVVVMSHSGSRFVSLDFQPAPRYWGTPDGVALIRTTARYAQAHDPGFTIEAEFSTIKPGETPLLLAHFHPAPSPAANATLRHFDLSVRSTSKVVLKRRVDVPSDVSEANLDLPGSLTPGFYTVEGTLFAGSQPIDFYRNGFWVEDKQFLESGPALGSNGDFLTRGGRPFFPFGTNYFSTESNGWDFSGPRNAAVWEHDFADMEKHGVTFVRTGVWNGQLRAIEAASGRVSERFLRNVEAYLLCARRHNIAVNFTFFAFEPQSTLSAGESNPVMFFPGSNPYLDPLTIKAEQSYMLAIVNRFRQIPYLSWDLINEPSFSNPKALWHGNTPNYDAAELTAWHAWLRSHYQSVSSLATAWSTTPDQLGSIDSVPLPATSDMQLDLEHGDARMVRAGDYNLFAQESFSRWVHEMVSAIRATGSTQLIDVGQDEGGVENRVLNQFYAQAGVSFTTNHTYRQNANLLWDSLAAKAPGIPNIVGETGYQPVTYPSGKWRFDELSGFALLEQKWAVGFAAGTSGSLSWDWDREIYFGIERSDGSAKIWEGLMRDVGAFAAKAQQYATGLMLPDVAVVLPQSLQLSVFNRLAVEAQQKCIQALYGYAHSSAYAVGEDQIDLVGHPKLIIVPAPWIISSHAWDVLLQRVRGGATLLISGRFDLDEHFLPTDRAANIGVAYSVGQLDTVYKEIVWPEGSGALQYGENKTDYLQEAKLPNGQTFKAVRLGEGRVLFSTLPLEVNDNLGVIGEVYRYALRVSGSAQTYATEMTTPDFLICPTRFPHATLYVISSQGNKTAVSFHDARSGREFSSPLASGRAALLLVSESGELLASYNWAK